MTDTVVGQIPQALGKGGGPLNWLRYSAAGPASYNATSHLVITVPGLSTILSWFGHIQGGFGLEEVSRSGATLTLKVMQPGVANSAMVEIAATTNLAGDNYDVLVIGTVS